MKLIASLILALMYILLVIGLILFVLFSIAYLVTVGVEQL